MRLRFLPALVAAALSLPALARALPQDAGPDAGAAEEPAPAVTWTEDSPRQ